LVVSAGTIFVFNPPPPPRAMRYGDQGKRMGLKF